MAFVETSTRTLTRPSISVDIFSDVVCPWCYIGKRRFAKGLAMVAEEYDVDFEVSYHPHQLDPTAAPGKTAPVAEAYARKFGGPERAEQILEHLTETARAEGLEFHMDRALRANTLLAHRLLWLAGQPESSVPQDALKERLLEAYFTDGLNIGDPDVLADCAAGVGFDRDEIVSFLDSGGGLDEVRQQLEEGYRLGITAVPTYVVGDQWAIPGAQEPETFARVLGKLAAQAVGDGG